MAEQMATTAKAALDTAKAVAVQADAALEASVSSFLPEHKPTIDQVKQTLGVPLVGLFAGCGFIASVLLFSLGGARFVVDLTGFVYPAYMSFKALESKSKADKDKWLMYWVVFAMFKLAEGVGDVLLSWIPFFFVMKLAFLIWCYHPVSHGAELMYTTALRPTLRAVTALAAAELRALGFDCQDLPTPPPPPPGAAAPAPAGYRLDVEVLQAVVPGDACAARVEVQAMPPMSRARWGVEGTRWKTRTMTAKTLVLNERYVISPLKAADGKLVVTLVQDMDTFGDDVVLGEERVALSRFATGEPEQVELSVGGGRVLLSVVLTPP